VFLLPVTDSLHAALVLIGYAELEKSIEPNFVALEWRGGKPPSEEELDSASTNAIQFQSDWGRKCRWVSCRKIDEKIHSTAWS
jgi:hypothetical protein